MPKYSRSAAEKAASPPPITITDHTPQDLKERIDDAGVPIFDEFGLGTSRFREDAILGVHPDKPDASRIKDMYGKQYDKLRATYPSCNIDASTMPVNSNQWSWESRVQNHLRWFLNTERTCVIRNNPSLLNTTSVDVLGLNSPPTVSPTSTSSREKELEGLFPPQTREEEMKGLFDSPKAGKRRRSKKRVTKKRRNGKKTIKRKH